MKDNKPDAAIRDVLNEVLQKGFQEEEIKQKVEKKLDKRAAIRVRGLLPKQN